MKITLKIGNDKHDVLLANVVRHDDVLLGFHTFVSCNCLSKQMVHGVHLGP